LVQLRHTAPQELLYSRHYWYRSGVTDTMRAHLRDVAASAMSSSLLGQGDVVLDIGSNDGTLLREYPKWLCTVGFEPATNLAEQGAQEVSIFVNEFWSIYEYQRRTSTKAKVITALGMFYDLDDPNLFIRDVAKALHPEGIFISQLMCLKQTLAQGDLGNLAHEHLEFYTLKSLHYLFSKHGLQIYDVQENDVNGGSYRIYACLRSNDRQTPEQAERVRKAYESEYHLDRSDTYSNFYWRVKDNAVNVCNFIIRKVDEGARIWVYGASTKGNVLLQYYGLDTCHIEGAADRSPEKWGKVTIGTGIPIYSEEEARKADPDYFLVLPYAFLPEFLEREKDWHDRGGKFIVPLPEFKVV
jgi:cyclopropane fatty-acyl-phospholipid synthase-like methyltransferase